MIILKYIGIDGWNRAVYQDENNKKRLFCDIDLNKPYDHSASIYTKYKGFEGEPDYPIDKKSYKFLEVIQ